MQKIKVYFLRANSPTYLFLAAIKLDVVGLLEKFFASKRVSGVTCVESGRGFRSLGEGTGLASVFYSLFHAPMRASMEIVLKSF